MLNALWILIFFSLFALTQMALFLRVGLNGVRIARSFTKERLFEGESLQMIELIENRRFLPLPWLRLESRMPASFLFSQSENLEIEGLRYHHSVFFLGPWRRVRRAHELKAARRGHYQLVSVSITVGDLLGIKSVTVSLPMQASVTVYPRLLPRERLSLPASRWQGEALVRRFIQPDPFLYNGIRAYQPGDAPRDIHWRAYARTGELKVKQRDYSAASKLLLLLNIAPAELLWGEIGSEAHERLEEAIRTAASLCVYALGDGLDVGLGSNADLTQFDGQTLFLPPSSGPQQRERLLEALARLRLRRAANFHAYLQSLPPLAGCDILVLSAYSSPLIERELERLRGNGNTADFYPFPG
ncbi:MAG: DUF58 domain-containing protein [Christensenellaceae bacterium]|jgi:uncharacterized protein (DUF58 family)|nr:DUF58 domain-containing protein [Christensenellaceae bacterium]